MRTTGRGKTENKTEDDVGDTHEQTGSGDNPKGSENLNGGQGTTEPPKPAEGGAGSGGSDSQGGGKGGEFVPPKTQEELDRIIQERVRRAEENTRKEFEGFVAPDAFKELNDKFTTNSQTLTKTQRENAAMEAGLDKGWADRLIGNSFEEWTEDAAKVAQDFVSSQSRPASPRATPGERRGQGGGQPGEEPAPSTDEILKKINRY